MNLRPGPSYRFAADLAGAGDHPRLCIIATAVGDDAARLAAAHNAFSKLGFISSHLTLFPMPNVPDVRAHLLAQDVIWVGGGSTANLLALWRLHGLDVVLRECWEAGVVLKGVSAGSLCWHVGGTTDSFGPTLRPVTDGLAFLPYSNSPHHDAEEQRRPLIHRLIADGHPPRRLRHRERHRPRLLRHRAAGRLHRGGGQGGVLVDEGGRRDARGRARHPAPVSGSTEGAGSSAGGLLQLEGLCRRFGALTALDHLTFSVPSGQVVGFLGPNGAGKTTTMRAVFGLTDLDAGTVRWNGQPVGQADRRRFGYMPEERGLYPAMQVGEQLEYLGRLHGMAPADARRAGEEWLERLGIADRAAGQGRGALPRQPAAGAAGRRPPARARPVGPGRAAGRTRPERDRRHRPRAGRAGPVRVLCPVLEPPARPGGGPLRVGRHHRPRPPRGGRPGRRPGHQRPPAPRGARRGRP